MKELLLYIARSLVQHPDQVTVTEVEIRRAETLRDRLQTVVPGIAPALLEFHPARRDIQLVVHDKDILGQKTVPRRERLYAFAGKVHEGLRLGDKPLVRAARKGRLPQLAAELVP